MPRPVRVDPPDPTSPAPPPVASPPAISDREPSDRGRSYGDSLSHLVAALWICAIVLLCGAFYFASQVLIPLAIATLASFALYPVIERLSRWGIPPSAAAAGILILLVCVLSIAIGSTLKPAQMWLQRAPQQFAQVGEKLQAASEPLAWIDKAEAQIDKFSEGNNPAGASEPLQVQVESPSLFERELAINSLGRIVAFLIAIGVITFFLLATGDELINRLLHVVPSFGERRKVVALIIQIQRAVGRYLGTITVINCGLGIAVSIVMWGVGMPTPLLWGGLATVFNFIPYLGALAAATIIFFIAAAHFDPLGWAFLTTGCFLALTTLEGQLITPAILGRTLRISPVLVLLGIAFWGFLWGISGVFVAVPMLIAIRIACSGFATTRPLAILLGEDPSPEEKEAQWRRAKAPASSSVSPSPVPAAAGGRPPVS